MTRHSLLALASGLMLVSSSALADTDYYSTGPGQGGPDTLDDVWQSLFNAWGMDPNADDDKDGCSNYAECLGGTDPRNPHDCVMVGNMAISAGNVVVTFRAEKGKEYRMWESNSPASAPPAVGWSLIPGASKIATVDHANDTIVFAKSAGSSKFYRMEVRDADSDNDGVSDWAENKLGTNPAIASSTGNGASDGDTIHSLLTLAADPTQDAGFERVDKTAPTPVVAPAKIGLTRTFGTMALNGITMVGSNGATDPTKGNASAGDYVAFTTVNIPANAGVPGTPYEVNVTPVQDNADEVPEYLKVTFNHPLTANLTAGTNATVCICDSDPNNESNNQLYIAYLGHEAGQSTTASGYATALVNGDNTNASISLVFNNLSSEQNTAYIRNVSGGVPTNDLAPQLPNGQVSGFSYNVVFKPGFFSTDQAFLSALGGGGIGCAVSSANFPDKEIWGIFNKVTGSVTFDPNNPTLVPPDTGTDAFKTTTDEQIERDIWRFMSQCTWGGTTAMYNAIRAKVDTRINALGGTPTNQQITNAYLQGLTDWLDEQMNPALTPTVNFRTLVMASDNEDFLLRGNKPSTYTSDPQINGSKYTVSYDAAGNPTIGTTADNNTIGNNYPQSGPNRRREWWDIMLQGKDQVRQRFTQALSEITIISEADQTVLDRHYGCANYWDMLAAGAFGKYRNLLSNVTYSPMMGIYLSAMANRATYDAGGGLIVSPDENYAREIMQLFSIGLVLRHPDGSLVLDGAGLPTPTYDQTDITELARVMTGFSHGARHAVGYQSTWSGTSLNFNAQSSQRVSDLVLFNGSSTTNSWFGRDDGHLYWAAPWIYPMKVIGRLSVGTPGITTTTIYHDFGQKTLLAGKSGETIVPAQSVTTTTPASDSATHAMADTDLTLAHNCLAGDPTLTNSYNGHQNTPVNISRWLIQRLVSSNPSAGYVYRVQKKYRDTNGTLGDVLKAILLDYEARSLQLADSSISHGKIKEPLVAFASTLRAFRAFSGAPVSTLKDNPPPFSASDSPLPGPYPQTEVDKFSTDNQDPPSLPVGWSTGPFRYRFNDLTSNIGQSPQRPPSVFNWFLPDYVEPGPMAEAGLFAPELQINTEASVVAKVNFHYAYTWSNLVGMSTQPGADSSISDFLLNNTFATPAVRFSLDGGQTFVSSLTFDASNWSVPKTLTVVGANTQNMTSVDNNLLRFNVTGVGSGYDGIPATPVPINLADNEEPNEGIIALHTSFSTWVQEGGATDTVTVRLAAPPSGAVTVGVTTTAGQVTVSPSTLNFDGSNWNTDQIVTVTAPTDDIAEAQGAGNDTLTFTSTSAIGAWNNLTNTLAVNVIEKQTLTSADATAAQGIVITETGGTTVVTENGTSPTTDTYTVKLSKQPTGNVTVTVSAVSGISVSPTSLTFGTTDFGTAKTVTVTPSNETTAENSYPANPIHYGLISHTANGGGYSNVLGQVVTVPINDDDNRIIISHAGTNATETRVMEGGSVTDQITVALRTPPTADVTVNLGSNSVSCNPANLVFTSSNYNTARTVSITAVDNSVLQGIRRAWNPKASYVSATANANLTGGAVSSLTIVNAGNGYTTPPTVTFSAPASGTTATATASINQYGCVTGFTITNGGSGYGTTPPTVTIASAPSANYPALLAVTGTGTTTISGGSIATISITNPGAGYLTPPSVSFTGAPTGGTTATGYATLNGSGSIASVTLTNAGAGYTTAPSITFTASPNNTQNVIIASATSAGITDTGYNNYWSATHSSLNVTILDNDMAAVLTTPSGGNTTVTEGNGSDDVTIALTQKPTANVTVTLSPSTQVACSQTVFTFTPANWSLGQTLTVTGVNDATVEGDALTNIGVLVASADPAYAGVRVKPIPVTVIDNDLVPLTITHTNVFTGVAEGGTAGTGGTPNVSDTFTIALPKTPTANVTVTPLFDASQVLVTPPSLTFTPTSSGTAQTVTVTAVDDANVEPTPHTTAIRFGVSSTDPFYNNPAHLPVYVPIKDNDGPGFSIVESSGNTTPTEGGTDTYTVVLTKAPATSKNVIIDVVSLNTADQTVSPSSLTFTTANWSTAQTVTVTAVADMLSEGREVVGVTNTIRPSTVNASGDPAFDSLPVQTVNSFITDQYRRNESLVIIPSGGSILSGGATATGGNTYVTEGSSTTDSIDFYLSNPPTIPVTVTLDANAQMGFNQSTFVFTPANWNVPQTVIVSAIDDGVADAPAGVAQSQNIQFRVAGDPLFANVNPTSAVNIIDNDFPGVSIEQTGGITNTSEAGGTDTYTIVLTKAPNNNVVVTATPASGAKINGFTTAQNFTFTTSNWNQAQTVTVGAVDDATVEGNHQVNITHTINTASTTDTSGYMLPLLLCNTTTGTGTITCASTAGLGVGMIVTGTGIPASTTVSSITNSTTFVLSASATSINTGITLTANITGIQTVVNNIDDNDNRIIITPTGTDTRVMEDGSVGDTYSVVLRSAPLGSNTVTITPATTGGFAAQGLSISPATLVFSSSNWNSAQFFTLSGVDNNIQAERTRTVTITHTSASGDANFNAQTIHSIGVNMMAKDTLPRVLVVSNPGVNENGNTGTYTLALSRAPLADVTMTINGGTQLEWAPPLVAPATTLTYASAGTLTFTTSDWMNFRTITVRAVDDLLTEPDINQGSNFIHLGQLAHTLSSSGTSGYELPTVSLTNCATTSGSATVTCSSTTGLLVGMGLTGDGMPAGACVASITNGTTLQISAPATATGSAVALAAAVSPVSHAVTIIDNETPAVRIIPSGGTTQLAEGGATDTYDVVLTAAPTDIVTINISVDSQITSDKSSLTFGPGDWNQAQSVTLTAVNDAIVEGNHSGVVTHSNAISNDPVFSGMPVPSLAASITDNDGAQLVVNQSGGSTSVVEGGANDTIQLSLSQAPTGTVTITLIPPMYIVPVPPYAKQFGYYTSDLSGSNQNRERVVLDYTELIQLYRTTFYASLATAYGGSGNIPQQPSDLNLQNAHWAATKAIVDKGDLWFCGGSLKARNPVLIEPNQPLPVPLPALNPRQALMDCIYQLNGGANSLGTTRYVPEAAYNPKSPPTATFDTEIRDRCRWVGYLTSTVMSGYVSH